MGLSSLNGRLSKIFLATVRFIWPHFGPQVELISPSRTTTQVILSGFGRSPTTTTTRTQLNVRSAPPLAIIPGYVVQRLQPIKMSRILCRLYHH